MRPIDRRSLLGLTTAAGITLAGAPAGTAYAGRVAEVPDAGPGSAASNSTPDPFRPKRQFRALWLASVVNIDWPSKPALSAAEQQAEFVAWLDYAVKLNLNAVICQVRPTADAFWPSEFEPWSQYLTGTQGGDPGYDPIAFQLAEARKRNLEYHAWFNPYRVSMQTDRNQLLASHPARQNPDWVFEYGGKLYYNPGLPAVRAFVQDAMLDVVRKYDIDAVHFDDYFYPYPVGGQPVPDAETYAAHGRGIATLEDWRRDNINLLVREMSEQIKALKPWVKFGISPFGIWRNAASDPRGSETSGTQSYDAISADSRLWVKEGWLDYMNPQIYWQIGLTVADYAKLAPWWASVVEGTGVALYIGQAAYKQASGAFTDPEELSKHLDFNHDYPAIDGDVYFSAASVRADTGGSTTKLVERHYTRPAIIPVIEKLGGQAPSSPVITRAARTAAGVSLEWRATGGHRPTSYAIWRVPGRVRPEPGALADATHLIATQRHAEPGIQTFTDPSAPTSTVSYVVTAYDRLWHESEPSLPRSV